MSPFAEARNLFRTKFQEDITRHTKDLDFSSLLPLRDILKPDVSDYLSLITVHCLAYHSVAEIRSSSRQFYQVCKSVCLS